MQGSFRRLSEVQVRRVPGPRLTVLKCFAGNVRLLLPTIFLWKKLLYCSATNACLFFSFTTCQSLNSVIIQVYLARSWRGFTHSFLAEVLLFCHIHGLCCYFDSHRSVLMRESIVDFEAY